MGNYIPGYRSCLHPEILRIATLVVYQRAYHLAVKAWTHALSK